MGRSFIGAMFWFMLAIPVLAQQAEPLSLGQAIAIALERNPQHKAALAEIRVASADVKESRSSFFPRAVFSEAATRSNDPVYVFGTRLRQSRFSTADFALNQLNRPTPIGDFITRFGGQWTVFDSFVTAYNVRKAANLKHAANERLARADQRIIYRVVEAYFGVSFGEKQVELAEHAASTAEAVLNESRARFEAGTTVESDYLAAQVDFASRQQELVQARNALALARSELTVAMGVAADHPYALVNGLSEHTLPVTMLAEAEDRALKQRADLKEIAAELQAGEAGVHATRASFGPRINVFADSELDNVSPFANGSNNWTAGAELQFDLFSGGQKSAAVSRARANVERMEAMKQAAEDEVRLEVRRAYYDFDSARQMLDVARTSVAQAEESLRIVNNRYSEGMTTITELLHAEDALRTARTSYWQAVYRYILGYASLQLATGELTPDFLSAYSDAHSLMVTP